MKVILESELLALPVWCRHMFSARNLRRYLAWHRKAHRGAQGSEHLLALISEFESGAPRAEVLEGLEPRFASTLEKLEGPLVRTTIVRAESACKARGDDVVSPVRFDEWYFEMPWLSKETIKKDNELAYKNQRQDLKWLETNGGTGIVAARGLLDLSLWPAGEPAWLSSKWPTQKEQRQRLRRMWGEDAPVRRRGGAPIRVASPRLTKKLADVFAVTRWDLKYVAEREVTELKPTRTAPRSVIISRLKAVRRTMTITGTTRFRRPAAAAQLALLEAKVRKAPRLLPLLEFYREHDGAVVFHPAGFPISAAYLEILGLADQRAAHAVVMYEMQNWDVDDPETIDRYMAPLNCESRDVHVLAECGPSFFLVPTRGPRAGHVFRFICGVWSTRHWATSVESGLAAMISEVAAICRKGCLLMPMGDEQGDSSELRLLSAKPAKRDSTAKPNVRRPRGGPR